MFKNNPFTRRSFIRSVAALVGGAMVPNSSLLSINEKKQSRLVSNSNSFQPGTIPVLGLGKFSQYSIELLKTQSFNKFSFIDDISMLGKRQILDKPVIIIISVDYILNNKSLIDKLDWLKDKGYVIIEFIDSTNEFVINGFSEKANEVICHCDAHFHFDQQLSLINSFLWIIENTMNNTHTDSSNNENDLISFFKKASYLELSWLLQKLDSSLGTSIFNKYKSQVEFFGYLECPAKMMIHFHINKNVRKIDIENAIISITDTPLGREHLICGVSIENRIDEASIEIIAGHFY